MSERLSLQDLIDLLADRQGITKKDAETFLREFIAVVSENIESGEPVKIKEFGAFKLVKVNARKSVDVNTGEAIEIAAHYKLSFTPDKSLKEAINRPFAHFESVVLEDGVSFDNVEDEKEDEVGEVEKELPVEDPGVQEQDENVETESQSGTEAIHFIADNVSQEDTDAEEEVLPVEEEVEEFFIEEPVAEIEQVADEEDIEPVAEDTDSSDIDEDDTEEDDEEDEFEAQWKEYQSERRKRTIWTIIIILLLLALGFLAMRYYDDINKFIKDRFSATPVVEQPKDITVADTLAAKADSLQSDSTLLLAVDSLKADTAKVGTAQAVEQPKQEVKKPDPKPLGVVTLRTGHTLRNISLHYYGNKSFWIYIYEENKDKITNPNNIPIGTKLVIPAPAKYGIDVKDAKSVEIAKAKETKLFKDMGIY
ncbi:HU family DNA-binding protein [Dysgonomonas sp. 511]|uniref:HU family DNA-binding protein n=1 Tax=Dysgonomonas sp. 511 TaxID=2302930 RepID=UPI0013CFE943|nr:HU family DNA-binding protein [Dysgonomonas sp. 511]NDV77462.1 HU family DNA-binding protein [Dysgonomonas sp. 511]